MNEKELSRKDIESIYYKVRCYYEVKAKLYEDILNFDTPYKGTKQYSIQNINYDEFYDFLRQLSKNNIVLVSEYNIICQMISNVFGKENAMFNRNQIELQQRKRQRNYLYIMDKYNLKENNTMKDSVKETLKRLGISLTKETDKGTCVKTSYELLEELAEKWETQLLKD